MRRALAFLFTALVLVLIGCSGDVSRATVTLGDSVKFSKTDLQGAADAVLAQFGDFEGCTLLRLTYDENFSMRQVLLAAPPLPEEDQVVVFTSEFWVDWTGQSNGMNPNSTYSDWTWTVRRADASAPWTVTNWGVS